MVLVAWSCYSQPIFNRFFNVFSPFKTIYLCIGYFSPSYLKYITSFWWFNRLLLFFVDLFLFATWEDFIVLGKKYTSTYGKKSKKPIDISAIWLYWRLFCRLYSRLCWNVDCTVDCTVGCTVGWTVDCSVECTVVCSLSRALSPSYLK